MSAPAIGAGLVAGFAVGAVIGFFWGSGTKSALSQHTTTTVDGQAVTVRVNYLDAARDGLLSGFRQ